MMEDKQELVNNEQPPASVELTPASDSQIPASDNQTPAADNQTPASDNLISASDNRTPALDPPPYNAPGTLPSLPPNYHHQAYNLENVQQQQQQQHYMGNYPYMGHGAPSMPEQVVLVRTLQAPPKDYLVMAILVTIFCCLPFGIVGIIKASEAKDMYATGNFQRGHMASQSAGKWTKAGFITGFVMTSIVSVLMVIWLTLAVSVVD